MSTKELFDSACQKASWNRDIESGFDYRGKTYNNYTSNKEFEKFKFEMCKYHNAAYQKFLIRELKEGQYPPRMASFASSSRMIYSLAKDIPNFAFEEDLPLSIIPATAHLDGRLSTDTHEIYVEAKCHEMFTLDKDISAKYVSIYENLSKNGFLEYRDRYFFWKGQCIERFYLKQVICHFIGIISEHLKKSELQSKTIHFIYLTHQPSIEEQNFIKSKQKNGLKRVIDVLDKEKEEIDRIDFNELFKELTEHMQVSSPICSNFEFVHCTDVDLKEHLQLFIKN